MLPADFQKVALAVGNDQDWSVAWEVRCFIQELNSRLENSATLAAEPDASSNLLGWQITLLVWHRIAENETHRGHVAGKSMAGDGAERSAKEIYVDDRVLSNRPLHAA